MRELEFRRFLEAAEKINSKDKAVNSRISRANTEEEIIGTSLDYVVADDDRMYEALLKIRQTSRERSGNIQNAVRWYYRFINGKELPTVVSYRRYYRKII